MRKSLIAAAAGAGVLSLALATLPLAQADPIGPPTYRQLAGAGSDTTQSLMNALALVVKDPVSGELVLGSYDAIGSPTITTKDPAVNAKCTITRPNGSTAGRNALQTSLQAADGCLQWARSSSSRGSYTSPVSMTWIPFATDALTFAVRSDGDVPRELKLDELKAIFRCEIPEIQPALVQTGSGTRSSWLSYMGITEQEITEGKYRCLVPESDGGTFPGKLPQEHDGRELKKNQVMPYSAAVYQAQIYGTAPDRRGKAVIGVVDGVVPTLINADFGNARPMFNIIPTSKVTDTNSLEYKVFVGKDSLVCKAKLLTNLQGFGNLKNPDDCGSTTSRS